MERAQKEKARTVDQRQILLHAHFCPEGSIHPQVCVGQRAKPTFKDSNRSILPQTRSSIPRGSVNRGITA